ncbi:DUF934 domain-containing protein [Alphaproteobacteria bacterium]|nr:DUF934 domain-containing protein [Alphaproteobacteria bacterium]MDC0131628.1 DUF934 domain-containing protein [Alphaproteobacteria bacterium]MDC0147892.1 DUF934 domain-containing protein [Alphaproteobacteria bacterium]
MQNNRQLIKDGALAENTWSYLEDETGLDDAPSLISLERLEAEAETLRARNAPLGVILRAGVKQGEDVRRLAPFLDMVQIVAIEFPVYRNGRGFTSARILREELKFTGEVRATGDVLFDQWQPMARCGINAFEVDEKVTLEQFQQAIGEFSDAYQPAADAHRGVLWRRHTQ